MSLSEEKGEFLIKLAEKAISESLSGKQPDPASEPFLQEKRGVFVTLKKQGELRGCIGFPEPIYSLGKVINRAAISAAFNDPRFEPLSKSETKQVKVEVTVLTKPKQIEFNTKKELLKQIEIGKHGLIARRGYHSGLLLPQVAEENNWDAKTFVQQTCLKAGISQDSYKYEDTQIFKFQGQTFT